MRFGLIATLLPLALVLTASAQTSAPRCYALLIGINEYQDKNDPVIADLTCTRSDCELMKSMLPALSGVAPERTEVQELVDAQAVKSAVLAALDAIATKAQPQDTLLIYYSGHGALVPDFSGDEPAGDGALVLYNFERQNRPPTPEEVAAGTLIDDEMAQQLRRFALLARVFYIADCCHSGGNERGASELVDKGFDLPQTAEQLRASGMKAVVPLPDANRLQQGNIVDIFASDSRRKAQEIRSAGHGAMTLCLSQILAAPQDYDANGDGLLTLDELSVGLRSKVDATVRGYSGGTKYQLSFVKSLDPKLWSLPAGGARSSETASQPAALRGVPEAALDELSTLLEQRCGGRYDAGSEPYMLKEFQFLDEDGTPRPDNVFLKSELYDKRGEPATTLRFSFSLDAPADVLAVIVFTDGQYYLAFPNNAESIAANAALGVHAGWRVGAYPFEIPSAAYYGSDRFLFEFSEQGWEYIVLICSPVALDDPYGQTGTAFDLLYPFGLLKDKVAAGDAAPASGASDDGKGFGGVAAPTLAQPSKPEVIAPGKKLTVLYQKYWLKE